MQQGHGFYNSSIVNICEKHGYQIALGSLYPMDHMFQNQAKLLVKNMLWRVRFNFLFVDTLNLLLHLLALRYEKDFTIARCFPTRKLIIRKEKCQYQGHFTI